jgi:hypothetical protein
LCFNEDRNTSEGVRKKYAGFCDQLRLVSYMPSLKKRRAVKPRVNGDSN